MEKLNINLDAYNDPEELIEIARVFNTLAAYAKEKAHAIRDRKLGEISDAQAQERQCEIFYNSLPDWAKW